MKQHFTFIYEIRIYAYVVCGFFTCDKKSHEEENMYFRCFYEEVSDFIESNLELGSYSLLQLHLLI